jgi:hypothetical protein
VYQWFMLLDMAVGPAVCAAWLNCVVGGEYGVARDRLARSSVAVEIAWVVLFVCLRGVLPVLRTLW